ncbi:hypothetical protein [Comamonas sp.]|uniref:hypothetical protein n=1 Tax=Comamonas sp. TaxID=34028 RepID=UPI0028A13CC4|nr:hypothetical protein [Comamonas sp.]
MTDKTEAQPEALRLAALLDVNYHEPYVEQAAAIELRRQHGEIERLRALAATCYAGLGGECDLPVIWLDALNDAANGEPFDADGLLPYTSAIRAQLVAQTNRAATAEQQVTALTQRLDIANRLNTDAREQLAQLSARQAAPDGWRLVPVEPTVAQINAAHARGFFRALSIPLYDAMLSAAPSAPEPEQLAVDGRYTITIECGAAQARFVITEMQIESAPSPAEYVGHAVSKAIAAIDKRRISHGIGATNVNL